MTVENAQNSSRILAIDVARVFATLFMVQGHTLDAVLSPQYRQGMLFDIWVFMRGFTAPMFMVLAGFSFTIVTLKRWESHSQVSAAYWKRVVRFASFIVLGYVLHMPVRTFQDLPRLDVAGWRSWWQVDVLQCIGLSLICLQLLALIAKTPKRFAFAASIGALVVIGANPLLWSAPWLQNFPFALRAYLDGASGSQFSFVPWGGYVFAGACLGYNYSRWRIQSKSVFQLLWGGGIGFVMLAIFLANMPFRLYSTAEFWTTSPNLFLFRFGGICLFLALTGVVSEVWNIPRNIIHLLAKNSLVIYASHLGVVYGSAWNNGLRYWFGGRLTPAETFGWIAALLMSMVILATVWEWCKQRVRGLMKSPTPSQAKEPHSYRPLTASRQVSNASEIA